MEAKLSSLSAKKLGAGTRKEDSMTRKQLNASVPTADLALHWFESHLKWRTKEHVPTCFTRKVSSTIDLSKPPYELS